ncbi:MAG TPA: NAD(P)/FAD-dependent oxidoreductase [Candidatus Krumholzibacteria bacterium]|nr:NAD(P)/FAD-dependent oxidoreductase [Candidatus Krumholzibacteria bacterium]
MTTRTRIESSYDAVIVGARVAGAATAMLLARAGLRVLAVERSARGSDTLSTHALMRAGVLQLHRWGVLDRIVAAGTPAIGLTTFHYGDEAIEVPIQERDGVGALYAPRRTVLDAALADAAQESGAAIAWGGFVEGVVRDGSGRVRGVELRDQDGAVQRVDAGIVIGADGVRSGVARAVAAETLREGSRPCAVLYGYWRGLHLNGTHWHYGVDVAAGAIPTNDDEACVFVAMRPDRYEARRFTGLDGLFGRVLAETSRSLALAVARAEHVGKLHPFAGRPGFIRASYGPGWALVGDAGCFKDPLTAHGMTDALRDADLLANAVVAGTPDAMAGYQAARDEFAVEFLELSDEVASFDWDLERAKVLHRQLSKLMNRECDLVRTFTAIGAKTEPVL